jgi:hypothetical protein
MLEYWKRSEILMTITEFDNEIVVWATLNRPISPERLAEGEGGGY